MKTRWQLLRNAIVGSLLAALALGRAPEAEARRLSSSDIEALALYVADVDTRDDWPDALVNYNVASSGVIDALMSDIDFDVQRDCTGLDSKNTTYMYVKFRDGTRAVYDFFLVDSHTALNDRRAFCFAVGTSAQSIIAGNAQTGGGGTP